MGGMGGGMGMSWLGQALGFAGQMLSTAVGGFGGMMLGMATSAASMARGV
ncbi:MAG TPA: hypothetical protein VD865_00875 [Stenotrophomonas sp.]|nr:hypothetical protein [Stenotrophomonas sp.]